MNNKRTFQGKGDQRKIHKEKVLKNMGAKIKRTNRSMVLWGKLLF